MNIRGLTACVGYADLLARSLARWRDGFDGLVVVTAPHDRDTRALCEWAGVECYATDVFTWGGASFNKGAALSEAAIATGLRDEAEWLIAFDSDIAPEQGWRGRLEAAELTPGRLYGAYRYQLPEDATELIVDRSKRMPQNAGSVLGFFVMFHNGDPRLPKGDAPLFDTDWPHAGNYDTCFTRRWPQEQKTMLSLPLMHLGPERENWLGRGKADELREMLNRRGPQQNWERERMMIPPPMPKRVVR